MVNRRKLFRKLVAVADNVSIWFEEKFNRNPKKKFLEMAQDRIPLSHLEKTIGKGLDL